MGRRVNCLRTVLLSLLVAVAPLVAIGCDANGGQSRVSDLSSVHDDDDDDDSDEDVDEDDDEGAPTLFREGREVFRYETFGDEAYWGGQLRLHEAIAGVANGGVGPGVSPAAALGLGLRVDVKKLSEDLREDLAEGRVDLNDPASTVALLRGDAVIGLKGFFDDEGKLTSLGVQCSLCHTTVDDSFAPGIGQRRDGWPNRELDIGGIIASAPNLSPLTDALGVDDVTLREVLRGWGRGRLDEFVLFDGIPTRPDGSSGAVLIPPLFELGDVGLMTWNGWSGIAAWVPLVINVIMHGQGNFSDGRLRDADRFPVAAATGAFRVSNDPDLATDKLNALLAYVSSIETPTPPTGSFDAAAAARGEALFNGRARCAGCHVPPLYTLPGWNLVPPDVIGVDSFHADRSPSEGYRVPPLRGVFTRTGGLFHDGRFATVNDVVGHFNATFRLDLTDDEKSDLAEFVKSL